MAGECFGSEMAAVTQQPSSQSELLFLLGKVPAHSFEPTFYATRKSRQTQKLHSELCGLSMQSVRRKHFHELQILRKIPLLNIFWLCIPCSAAVSASISVEGPLSAMGAPLCELGNDGTEGGAEESGAACTKEE